MPDITVFNDIYNILLDRIKVLGEALKNVAGQIVDIGVAKKELTKLDIEIEEDLASIISTQSGHHVIYSEEVRNTYTDSENLWIIDPISHTFNFLHGLPHYAIAISHLYKGEVIFSAVYDPSMDEMFFAIKGKGVYLNGRRVNVKSSPTTLSILYDPRPWGIDFPKGDGLRILSALLDIGRVKIFGSYAIHYAYVACGRAQVAISRNKDIFPEFAGKLLVEEAGGLFTDFHGNDLKLSTQGVIASNKEFHNQIIELLSKQ